MIHCISFFILRFGAPQEHFLSSESAFSVKYSWENEYFKALFFIFCASAHSVWKVDAWQKCLCVGSAGGVRTEPGCLCQVGVSAAQHSVLSMLCCRTDFSISKQITGNWAASILSIWITKENSLQLQFYFAWFFCAKTVQKEDLALLCKWAFKILTVLEERNMKVTK